jgi:4-hydroxy-tetrahydrodipicolinate synthase
VLVPCGTTGEAATLTEDEYKKVITAAVEEGKGRCAVVAGAGTNSTRKTIAFTKIAKELGVHGVLIVTPYYNKPPQEGLVAHYEAVIKEVSIPIIMYNVPGRTGVSFTPETVARLAEHKEIVAIKEASGSVAFAADVLSKAGENITLLCGDDNLALPYYAIGAKGVISVASNVVPEKVKSIYSHFQEGDKDKARAVHEMLMPLFKALFIESNPIPVKAALSLMGMIKNELRLPLVSLSEEKQMILRPVLAHLGLPVH